MFMNPLMVVTRMTEEDVLFGRSAAGRQHGKPSDRSAFGFSRKQLARRAEAAFKARQSRADYLPSSLFGEPAWNMLLALYLADFSGRPVTVSGLSEWSECPPTTGLRWLQLLEGEGLVRRRPNAIDKRMSFVELTNAGREALDAFFSRAPEI